MGIALCRIVACLTATNEGLIFPFYVRHLEFLVQRLSGFTGQLLPRADGYGVSGNVQGEQEDQNQSLTGQSKDLANGTNGTDWPVERLINWSNLSPEPPELGKSGVPHAEVTGLAG
jgi:hypothetical protein